MSDADRSIAIRDALAAVGAPVRLLFFEQAIGCDACASARRLLAELADITPRITVETLNLILDKDRAAQHGVDRVPAVIVSASRCDRIRFLGAPTGYELRSLLEAIRISAADDSGLMTRSRAQLAKLTTPVSLQVFFTPGCVYCPQMVILAERLAVESPLISATAIDATQYPDLVQRFNVNGVPKTVINDALEIIGAASEDDVVGAVLSVAERR